MLLQATLHGAFSTGARLRMTVWMGSASTSHALSRSAASRAASSCSLLIPAHEDITEYCCRDKQSVIMLAGASSLMCTQGYTVRRLRMLPKPVCARSS